MMVTVEEEVYEFLRKKAQEEGVSVPAIIRNILKEYFSIEDKTRDYKRQDMESSYIIVNGKKYYRINCKLEKRNEMLVKMELRKRGTTLNRLLKEMVMVTV